MYLFHSFCTINWLLVYLNCIFFLSQSFYLNIFYDVSIYTSSLSSWFDLSHSSVKEHIIPQFPFSPSVEIVAFNPIRGNTQLLHKMLYNVTFTILKFINIPYYISSLQRVNNYLEKCYLYQVPISRKGENKNDLK